MTVNPTRLVPAAAALIAVAATVLVFLDVDSPLRVALVAIFLLVCPGLALVRLLRLDDPLLELTLAVAFSLALAGLVAVALLYADLWSPGAGLVILVVITLVGTLLESTLSDDQPAT